MKSHFEHNPNFKQFLVITESSIYEMVEIGKNVYIDATISTNIADIKYKWANLETGAEITDPERVRFY